MNPVEVEVKQVVGSEIDALRNLYRHEMNCQVVHDSYHRRGFTNSFLFLVDGRTAGHALVTNGSHSAVPAGAVVEYYVLPVYRGLSEVIFRQLLSVSQPHCIEAQSNDSLLSLMLFEFGKEVQSDTILFQDALTTSLRAPSVIFRKARSDDDYRLFEQATEPAGDWLLEAGGKVVARGGFLTHYNPPYGDIHMEVADSFRRRGCGSYLVQELKRACYEAGFKPAARCSASNVASRRTLEKAGLFPCARILRAGLRAEE